MNPYIIIALSSASIYLFVVLAIRVFGKNELSQLSIVDLVFILLISNSVQSAMIGTNSTVLGGIVAATSLFIVNWLLRNLLFKNKKISQLLQDSKNTLIRQIYLLMNFRQRYGNMGLPILSTWIWRYWR
jgi:uncharacterized membrane protein YcaP (DUF421 family)